MRIQHIGWRRAAVLTAAGALAAFAGIGGAGLTPAAAAVARPADAPPHIMTIMMENTDYSQVAGSAAMPYLNELAHQYADFTDAWGWTYPSLPNYLELLSGSDDGTSGEDCDITDPGCGNFTNPTLVDQLDAAGISWNAYYQGDPAGCYQGDGSGNYPYWHNAFRYFADFRKQCSHISGFGDLLSNLSSPTAAAFQWVVPDLVNSGGDNGTMASGDSWLNGELPKIMASSWYRAGGQIVILFDTGYQDGGGINGSDGGQIPMVVISAHTRGMGAIGTPINTAGVLRSVEHAYGVAYLGDAADAANGTLGQALVAGRPVVGAPVPVVSEGAVLGVGAFGQWPRLAMEPGSLSINGIAATPTGWHGGGQAPLVAVGQNATGHGVVVAFGGQAAVVPGTADLESVACSTSQQCYAVGLGALNSDEAVLVSIVAGHAVSVTDLPAFIGLYGIACPTESTCYAVGYDNSDDADAVTTITDGGAGDPVEVAGGGEWLNAISCASATECYAAGLVNYNPSIVPIASGQPGTAVTIPNAWYVNGIDCPSVGTCVAVGENATEQGIVGTLEAGSAGPTTVIASTEYLYGVACVSRSVCLVAGAGTPAADGYSAGVVAPLFGGFVGPVTTVPNTNGLGQVIANGYSGYLAALAAYSA
jgi:phosphatidylinositol-3-phosphatase